MIYITNLILLTANNETSTTVWEVFSGLGALLGAIVAAVYTCLTYQLLSKTTASLNLSTKAIELNEKTLAANNKLTEYQIYKEFGEKLYQNKITKLLSEIKSCSARLYFGDELDFVRFEVLNHLEDLAKFYEDKLISIESVNTGFGSMILYLGNNDGVKQIIKDEREIFPTIFSGFENLYNAIFQKCTDQERVGFKPTLF